MLGEKELLGIIFQPPKNGWIFEVFANGVIARTPCHAGQTT
jgi:hypothetical protein